MKYCKTCDTTKPLFEFYKNKASKDNLTIKCKECCKIAEKDYHRRNPTKKINRNRKDMITKLGLPITVAEHYQMIVDQDNKCAICKNEMQKPCIDHNHSTKVIRKLLCQHCNSLLGMAKENVQILENAIEYINLHS
jgi:hypothetical protein